MRFWILLAALPALGQAKRARPDKKELKLYVTKNGHKNHKFERVDGRSWFMFREDIGRVESSAPARTSFADCMGFMFRSQKIAEKWDSPSLCTHVSFDYTIYTLMFELEVLLIEIIPKSEKRY